MSERVVVGQKVYELPQGLSYCFFEQTGNAAILKTDPKSTVFEGRSVIDSEDLKGGTRGVTSLQSDVVRLLERNGGKYLGKASEFHAS